MHTKISKQELLHCYNTKCRAAFNLLHDDTVNSFMIVSVANQQANVNVFRDYQETQEDEVDSNIRGMRPRVPNSVTL